MTRAGTLIDDVVHMANQAAGPFEERTFRFACEIVRFCRELSGTAGVHRQVASQLLRSGTSVGANVVEARSAFTRREFACKCAMVLRECRETPFWLRLIRTTELSNDARLEPLIRESSELVAIFTTAARKARTPLAADSPNL